MRCFTIACLLLISILSNGQNMGVGTNAPSPSAILDISSNSKGFLMPRMTTAQRNSIVNPATGLQVFNTDDQCTDIYDGSNWIKNCGLKVTGLKTVPGHPDSNSWLQKANLGGVGRNMATGFSIGTRGYIGTGADGQGFRKDFWEYNSVLNVWSQKADFGGTARSSAVGFSIGNKGYIGTGADQNGATADFWEYDPSVNQWTQKLNFGGGVRYDGVGISLGAKGYIGLGIGANGYSKDFWEYDPSLNQWVQKTDFGGTARFYACGFATTNMLYVGTGQDHNSVTKDFWEYDPSLNQWTQKTDFGGTARFTATAFTIGNKGYIGTGEDASGYRKDLWQYDPVTNAWTQKADLSGTARSLSVGFGIDNKGYIVSGIDQTMLQNDLWEYVDNNVTGYTYSSNTVNTENTNTVSNGAWTLQNGNIYNANSGNVGIGTATPSSKLEVNGAIHVTGFQNTDITQGARLEWNKQVGLGRTYLLNQKGLGPGGIVLGEIDANNNVSPVLTTSANGNATVTGNLIQQVFSQSVSLAANSPSSFQWVHNLGYQPVIMVVKDQTGGAYMDWVGVSYHHDSNNQVTFHLTNHNTSFTASGTVRWIVVN